MSTTVRDVPTTTADPMLPAIARIVSFRQETHDVGTFGLSMPDSAPFHFLPGQFNMLFLPPYGEAAISVSSDSEVTDQLAHTIRFVGTVTKAMSHLHAGDVVGIRGPYGSAWPIDQAKGRDLLLVAGGIGLAPLRPVIYHVIRHRADFRHVTLLYGARTAADLLFTSEYEKWRAAEIEIHVTVDRGDPQWKGTVGVVPLLFYRLRLEARETVVFTCGPEAMMHFVIFEGLARRIPKDSIFASLERNMKCAIGLCGHCQYGPLFVCRDGPVISFSRLEPYFYREEY